jgi:hypothetical protein
LCPHPKTKGDWTGGVAEVVECLFCKCEALCHQKKKETKIKEGKIQEYRIRVLIQHAHIY